jgi:pimeloyl-ACP methyl ester carboxylesterase
MKPLKKFFKWLLIALVVIFALISSVPYLIPLQEQESFSADRKPFPNSQIEKFDEVWVHYRVFEAKNEKKGNILLLHGFSGSTFSWRKNVTFPQEKGYQVLCIDLPAFGYSDRLPTWNHSVENRANLAWKIAEKISPNQKWHLAGHSMGASIVLAMGQLRPEKTQKIFCIDGLYAQRNGSILFKWIISYPPVNRWAEILLQKHFSQKDKFKEILHSAYSQNPDDEAVEGYLTPMLLKGTATAILSTALAKSNFKFDYKNVSKKMIVIWGDNDQWISQKIAEKWHKNYPEVPFISIKEAGHCPMETHSQEFNAVLGKYLTE